MREKVLLSGETNTSKTLSLVSLALLYPNNQVIILDPDDGAEKTIAELGVDLPNLTLVPVTDDWAELIGNYQKIKEVLGPGDWLCMDMLGRFWDLAQQFYSSYVFGRSPLEHLMTMRKQTEKVSFGGFDGLTDWALIKRLHNEQLMDDAVIRSNFNVMATTSVREYLSMEKAPKTGQEGIYASEFGVKPEGEKHLIYRFDTQAVMYRKRDGSYNFRLVRDRGRAVDTKQEFNITGSSFWQVYCDMRGIEL